MNSHGTLLVCRFLESTTVETHPVQHIYLGDYPLFRMIFSPQTLLFDYIRTDSLWGPKVSHLHVTGEGFFCNVFPTFPP